MSRALMVRAALVLCVAGLLAPAASRAQSLPPAPAGAEKLPAVIPIFPLEDAMLFPEVSRPLHIFEARYRAMIADALKGDRVIGMVTLKPGYDANYEGRPDIHPIGCAGEIVDFEELPDGRYNIVLRGFVKFRVVSEDQSKPYRLARVDAMPEVPEEADGKALHEQRQRLEALLAGPGGDSKIPPQVSDVEVVNAMSEYAPIAAGNRQALLEVPGVLQRSKRLIELLDSNGGSPR